MTQRTIQFEPPKKSQAERCARVLAGVPQVQTAARYFDDAGEQHANRERVQTLPTVQEP
jgi:hypothetical protein